MDRTGDTGVLTFQVCHGTDLPATRRQSGPIGEFIESGVFSLVFSGSISDGGSETRQE